MHSYLPKYSFYYCLICFAIGQHLFAQNGKGEYGCWSEPLFEDNIADFEAQPGSYEFSLNPGAYRSEDNWLPDIGWEAEVTVTHRLGFEMGFYSSWGRQNGEAVLAEATQVAFCFQYMLAASKRTAWATGAEFYSPGWSKYALNNNSGWQFRPYLIYGQRRKGGFNSQWRFSPGVVIASDGLQGSAAFQNASFLEKEWFSIGMELGASVDGSTALLFGAPQMGVSLGDFSLWVGWRQPWRFDKTKTEGLLLFSVSYFWEK
jgi:hypothetical protein